MGFIKIYRTIREWGWYDDPSMLSLWVHLLLSVNWKDGDWHGEKIGRGSMITSTAKLSADTGLSIKQVRTCLERLVDGGQIVRKVTNKWTKITVCNYDAYQSDDDNEGQAKGEQTASKRQADGNQTATIEKGKNAITEIEKKTSNEVKESSTRRFVRPTVDQVREYCYQNGYDIDAENFINYYDSKGWVVGKSPMKDWKAAVRTWVKNRRENYGGLFQTTHPAEEREWPNGKRPQG